MLRTRLRVALILSATLSVSVANADDPASLQEKIQAAQNKAAKAALDAKAASDLATHAAEAAKQAADAAQAAAQQAKLAQDEAARLSRALDSVPDSSANSSTGEELLSARRASSPLATTQDSKALGGVSSILVTANQAGGNATIKFSQPDKAQQDGKFYSLTLSSPISKSSDTTQLGTLDGLANSANASFSLAHMGPLNKDHLDSTPFFILGASGKVGYQTFNYYDGVSLAKKNSAKIPTSASVFVGVTASNNVPLMFLARFEYQNAYKDADGKVLCPNGSSFPITCVSGAIGLPKRTEQKIVSFEGRYEGQWFEIRPTVSYDTVSKIKGFDFPVYFINGTSADGKPIPFNAGIDLGWRSDKHQAVIGLFVGTPFSFWQP